MSKVYIEFLHEQNPLPYVSVPAVEIDANLAFISTQTPTSFTGIIYGENGQLAQAGIGSGLQFINGILSVVGGVTGQLIVLNEVPSGAVNGSNATFTTLYDFVPGSLNVYINGVMQKQLADYNTTGTKTINLFVSPSTGENILVNYERS